MSSARIFICWMLPFCMFLSLCAQAGAKTVEKDSDNDGRVDQVARFNEKGELVLVSVDADGDGRLERKQHYRDGNLVLIEEDTDGDGFCERRDEFRNENRFKQEIYTQNRRLRRVAFFDSEGKLKQMRKDTKDDGILDTVFTFEKDVPIESVRDKNDNGIWEMRQEFVHGKVLRRLQDKNEDGFAEAVFEFDARSNPVKSSHDMNADKFRETVRLYENGEIREQKKLSGPNGGVKERTFFKGGEPEKQERYKDDSDKPYSIVHFENGRPVSQKKDLNADGHMDQFVFLDAKGNPRRQEKDSNHDGKIDRVSIFKDAKLIKQVLDEDMDGFRETEIDFKNEKRTAIRRDLDANGKFEEFIRFDEQGNRASLKTDQSGDGQIDTWQDYERGQLQKLRRDSNGNGRVDTRVFFENGKKTSLLRDADGDGYFETRQEYGRGEWDMVLEHRTLPGKKLSARLYYKQGALRKKDSFADHGKKDFVEFFDAEGNLVKSREREGNGLSLTWFYNTDGAAVKALRDRNMDGRPEEKFFYENGRLVRVEEDSNADGNTDVWEYFDSSEALVRREKDLDFDGKPDLVKEDKKLSRSLTDKENDTREEG